MEAAGLVLAVVAVFKDAYLVARFVYNTVNSGIKHAEERIEISAKLRQEVLFLQSFGTWFVDAQGRLTSDTSLNAAWLQEIRGILEYLKLDLAEYRDLAEKTDEQYRKYSPTIHQAYQSSGRIEFELVQDVPPLSEPSLMGQFGRMFSKKAIKDVYVSGEWALFRKRKLEKLVARFEKRNKTLRHILQIAIPVQIQALKSPGNKPAGWFQTEHPDRLGMRGHVQIATIQQVHDHETTDTEIRNARLLCDGPDLSSPLSQGDIRVELARNNVQREKVLVEFKQHESKDVNERSDTAIVSSRKDHSNSRRYAQVSKLAALLKSSGCHDLGTLPLKGFIDQADQSRYAFVFNYPEGADKAKTPSTLHSIIASDPGLGPSKPWPLGQRFRNARKIATILGAFHLDGWVHKSMRSHSIAYCYDAKSKDLMLKRPYLINFEYSRLSYNTTHLERDEDSEKDLYRHPALQETDRQDSFSCVHDIYALGVVLLEVALWKTASDIIEEYAEQQPRNASEIRRLYIKVAKLEVPWLMGDAFLEAILACLSDEYEDDFLVPDRNTFREKVVDKMSSKALLIENF